MSKKINKSNPQHYLFFIAALLLFFLIIFLKFLYLPSAKPRLTQQTGINTSFKAAKDYDLNTLYKNNPYNCKEDFGCVSKYLNNITSTYGPKAALDIFQMLLDKKIVSQSLDDHQLAHRIGRKTAEVFGINTNAFDLCPTSFNYGCQHGFFEYVLGQTSTPKQAAKLICESIDASKPPKSKFYCYHGVGHGVMMAQAYNLKGALNICDSFDSSIAWKGCWQGVFMENVNAGMVGEAREGLFSKTNPLSPCDKVDQKYQHECYINHAGWLMTFFKNDVLKASNSCLNAKGTKNISSCLQGIGLMTTNPSWQINLYKGQARDSNEIAWSLCQEFPSDYTKDCVIAAIDNISNFDELNLTRATEFCNIISGQFKNSCFTQIGNNMRYFTTDTKYISSKCSSLGVYSNDCLKGAGIINETN